MIIMIKITVIPHLMRYPL